jgi:protein SCO1
VFNVLRKDKLIGFIAVAFATATICATSHARDLGIVEEGPSNQTPEKLQDIGVTEKLGNKIDLTLPFRDEEGKAVTLANYFQSGKPVLLSPAYYTCPNLCNYHLNGMTDMLRKLNWTIGREFEYVVVSIDPRDTPQVAKAKKENYLKAYGRVDASRGWHFLSGDEASVKALMSQVGFKYRWDEEGQQYAHVSSAQVITPTGEISRYLNGITFDPQTVRLSMVEASNGMVGSVVDKLILYCFHYDPKASKYTPYLFGVMRIGAILIVLVLLAFLAPFWWRQRKQSELQGSAGLLKGDA